MAKKLSDGQVLAAFQDLSTCNISDALDRMGLVGQVTGVLPLWHGCPKIAGPAMTMKLSPEARYSTVMGTLEAIQESRAGEVLVIDNGGRADSNSFGGIATFSAKHYNMQGCVIDGATRDVDEMAALHFPVFGKGVVNTSVRGRIGFDGYGIPVKLGGVEVRPWRDGAGHFVRPTTLRKRHGADQNGVVEYILLFLRKLLPRRCVGDVALERWSSASKGPSPRVSGPPLPTSATAMRRRHGKIRGDY